jgi:hypothetical protein
VPQILRLDGAVEPNNSFGPVDAGELSSPAAATYPIKTGMAPGNAPNSVHIGVRRSRGVYRNSRWPTPATVRFGITKLDKIQPVMAET